MKGEGDTDGTVLLLIAFKQKVLDTLAAVVGSAPQQHHDRQAVASASVHQA